jgi:hypothetical protein
MSISCTSTARPGIASESTRTRVTVLSPNRTGITKITMPHSEEVQIDEKIADALNFQLIVANATNSGGVFINTESAHIIMKLLVEKLDNMKGGEWI